MTGGVWRGRLTYFDKSDLSSPVASDGARRVSGAGPAYGVARAIASGARVINVSLGIDWLGIGHPPGDSATWFTDSSLVADERFAMGDQIAKAFLRLDDLNQRRPLLVIAAGNNAVDAKWSAIPDVANETSLLLPILDQVIVVGGLGYSSAPLLWRGTRTVGSTLLEGSNGGNLVDLLAPAQHIHALKGGDADTLVSGTSLSVPQVVAAAALALAADSTLSARSVKQLILDGAANGGAHVANPGGSGSKASLPTLDAYETLKLVARKPGTPLCGNRIWSLGSQVMAQRGASTETIGTIPHPAYPISLIPDHGGRAIGVLTFDSTTYGGLDSTHGFVLDAAGHWSGYTTLPASTFDRGPAGSGHASGHILADTVSPARLWSGRSHGGDTVVYAFLEMPFNTAFGGPAPSSCVQVFRSLVTPGDSLVRNTPTACRAYQQSVAGFSVQIAERERPPNAGRRATRR